MNITLAERLQPEPRLIPTDFEQRLRMFGLINEIAGENGLGWNKRFFLVHQAMQSVSTDSADYEFWKILGDKYQYTPLTGARAKTRMIDILNRLNDELSRQHARGNRYLLGEHLSALDIYAACFYALLEPLPPELCPMATSYRPAYRNADPEVERAMSTALAAHREFIYHEHLQLPIVF